MDKTPGQVVCDKLSEFDPKSPVNYDASALWMQHCNEVAAAVIAHIRPQIEAEARAAALEDAAKLCEDFGGFKDGYSCASEIRALALASAPPGHVCVPVSVATFAALVIKESRDELGDLDGGWLQDNMQECGILEMRTAIESCGDECRCAGYGFPSECFGYTPEVKAMLAARLK